MRTCPPLLTPMWKAVSSGYRRRKEDFKAWCSFCAIWPRSSDGQSSGFLTDQPSLGLLIFSELSPGCLEQIPSFGHIRAAIVPKIVPKNCPFFHHSEASRPGIRIRSRSSTNTASPNRMNIPASPRSNLPLVRYSSAAERSPFRVARLARW